MTDLVKIDDLNNIALEVTNESVADTFASGTKYACHSLGGITRSIRLFALPAGDVSVPTGVVVARKVADALAALQDGKNVMLFPEMSPLFAIKSRFTPALWSPVWYSSSSTAFMGLMCDPAHPAFATFPTEFHSNWQWYNLMNKASAFILTGTPASLNPIIRCIDNFAMNRNLAYMIEARVGKGKLLLCGIPLPDMIKTDVAVAQLMKSICAYVASDKFSPGSELAPTWIEQRCSPLIKSRVRDLGARVIATDSEQKGSPASNVLDGNLSTIWESRWLPKKDNLPHYILIDLGKDVTVKGVSYVHRSWMKKNRPSECEVYLGDDADEAGPLVAKGTLKNSNDPEKWLFDKPAKGRYLNFVVKAVFDGDRTQCKLSELDIIEKE